MHIYICIHAHNHLNTGADVCVNTDSHITSIPSQTQKTPTLTHKQTHIQNVFRERSHPRAHPRHTRPTIAAREPAVLLQPDGSTEGSYESKCYVSQTVCRQSQEEYSTWQLYVSYRFLFYLPIYLLLFFLFCNFLFFSSPWLSFSNLY